jgi:hypothetical protein
MFIRRPPTAGLVKALRVVTTGDAGGIICPGHNAGEDSGNGPLVQGQKVAKRDIVETDEIG